MSFNPRQWDRLIAQGFQAGSQNPLDWLLRDHARLRARVEELEQVQGVGAEEYLVMRHRAHEAERLLKTSNDEVAERERDEAREQGRRAGLLGAANRLNANPPQPHTSDETPAFYAGFDCGVEAAVDVLHSLVADTDERDDPDDLAAGSQEPRE